MKHVYDSGLEPVVLNLLIFENGVGKFQISFGQSLSSFDIAKDIFNYYLELIGPGNSPQSTFCIIAH